MKDLKKELAEMEFKLKRLRHIRDITKRPGRIIYLNTGIKLYIDKIEKLEKQIEKEENIRERLFI